MYIFRQRFPTFNHKPRSNRKKVASTTEQLRTLLKNAVEGDLIHINAGSYYGPFVVNASKVYIEGEGEETTKLFSTSKSSVIGGHFVTITNLKLEYNSRRSPNHFDSWIDVTGGNCLLKNVTIVNCSLVIYGGFNNGQNLIFIGNGNQSSKIYVKGKNNTFKGIKMTGAKSGIDVSGNRNCFGTIKSVDVDEGIVLRGDFNRVAEFNFNHRFPDANAEDSNKVAIHLAGGSFNSVSTVYCHGRLNATSNFHSLKITLDPEGAFPYESNNGSPPRKIPKENSVTNCGPGPVDVCGRGNRLVSVDAGVQGVIKLRGGGHRIERCKGRTLMGAGDCRYTVATLGCEFSR